MKEKIFFFLIFCLILPYISPHKANNEEFDEILDSFIQTLLEYFSEIEPTLNISSQCNSIIHDKYINEEKNKYYLTKLLLDSSKNRNDVTSFSECMRKTHYYKNVTKKDLTYLMVFIDKRDVFNQTMIDGSGLSMYFFGVCFANDCTQDDYKDLVNKTILFMNNTMQISYNNMTVFLLDDYSGNWNLKVKHIAYMIPFFLIIIQLIMVIWNSIPMYISKLLFCCMNRKRNKGLLLYERSVADNIVMTTFDASNNAITGSRKQFPTLVKSAFDISKNGEELFNYSKMSKDINNDQGLTYIKGIRGISMLFLIFGFIFFDLFNSPVSLKSKDVMHQNFSSVFFTIFFFGMKFSPKILLSCSGYILFYKLVCYLDDRVEDEKQKNEDKNQNDQKEVDDSQIESRSGSDFDSSIMSSTSTPIIVQYTKWKFVCIFICYQLHKYILFIGLVIFLTYSLYYVALIIKDASPMWIFFHDVILAQTKTLDMILSFFLIHGYFFPESHQDSLINHFWLVINEMTFFLLSTFIIFIAYKYHYRVDRFVIFTLGLLFLFRNIYYYINQSTLLSTDYYSYIYFGKFMISPLYTFFYYLIGVYFSMLNYTLQKGFNYEEAEKQDKTYLFVSIKLINKLRNKSKICLYSIGFICLLVILVISFSQYLLFLILNSFYTDPLPIFFKNPIIGAFMIYDSDILVVLFHLCGFIFYLKGDNIISKFLSSSFWSILNKLYFCYILVINPVILYVLYQSETRINFDMSNCFFYGLICGLLMFFVCTVTYIVFEMPYKRLIHLIFSHIKKRPSSNLESLFSTIKQGTSIDDSKIIDLGIKDD